VVRCLIVAVSVPEPVVDDDVFPALSGFICFVELTLANGSILIPASTTVGRQINARHIVNFVMSNLDIALPPLMVWEVIGGIARLLYRYFEFARDSGHLWQSAKNETIPS
jgi:hypothetical protein